MNATDRQNDEEYRAECKRILDHTVKLKLTDKDRDYLGSVHYSDGGATTEARLRVMAMFNNFYRGLHHLPGCKRVKWVNLGAGSVNHFGDLSTIDFDDLTRLVMLAHAYCVRASIQYAGPRAIKIILSARYCREGDLTLRHPLEPTLVKEPEWEVAPL